TGIKGVEYSVNADSVYQVMWAMMPSSSSTINITNSKIRSIGLWFDKPKDSVIVSGITDNATYSSFTTPLSDRALTFNNCTVQTWSFYVFHKSIINVSGCIAGEIGTENGSKMYGNNYMVDGSGGYHWTSDTSTITAGNATVNSYVRSEKNGFFIFAYGTIGNSGLAEAIDNALLIVVQSLVPADPTAINGGTAWFDNINQTGNLFADSIAPINGSAWIHNGPTSTWMHFKSWQLFYQATGATTWIPITGVDTNEVSNNLLANWNTHTLNSGTYDLDLRITDSWGNKVDGIKQVTLLPLILGINELNNISGINIYPNPANQYLTIGFSSTSSENVQIEISDISGKQVLISRRAKSTPGKNTIQLNTNELPSGTYICHIITNEGSNQQLLEISK
ncbi:MAG TPA: T9SS type A sorting domain-containing protein, partial [Bacteroidia bacterium]|nr:T9SS type A sorting domain-containing protein [Bacteroidia bacterium]